MTIPLFPHRPNWASSLKVTREFKTDIIRSRSGKEQRRAVRNQPRKKVEFKVTEIGDRVRLLAQALNKQMGATIYLGDFSRSATLTSALAAGGSAVNVDQVKFWMTGKVVLVSGDAMEVRTGFSTASGVLSFSDTSANAWPAGTMVYPALQGRLNQDSGATRPSDGVLELAVSFDVTPTSEPVEDPGPAPIVFNSREVFVAKPNWAETFSVNFRHPFETVDYGMGAIEYFNPIAFASLGQQVTYLEVTRASMNTITAVFLRAKGQRGEFYMPTWVDDLPLKSFVGAGNASFTTPGATVGPAFADDTVFKAICVVFKDGTFAFNRVTSFTAVGADTLVHCAQPWAVDLDPAKISMVSWMPCCRFASDAMTVEWITDAIAQSQLNVVSLQDLTPET